MGQQIGHGVILHFEFFVREHGMDGVVAITTYRQRDLSTSAAWYEVMVGGMHVWPFAQGAGIGEGGFHRHVQRRKR